MQPIKQTLPEHMTPDQRRAEVAALLAFGLMRLRERNALRFAKEAGEGPGRGAGVEGSLGTRQASIRRGRQTAISGYCENQCPMSPDSKTDGPKSVDFTNSP